VFRLGVEHALAAVHHARHNAVWRQWTRLAFTVSSDPVVLQETLDVAARSLAHCDDTLSAHADLLQSERAEVTGRPSVQPPTPVMPCT
jgi:hypothetical protein